MLKALDCDSAGISERQRPLKGENAPGTQRAPSEREEENKVVKRLRNAN